LDGMVKRRVIRFLVPYSRTHYFIDKGVPRGLVYEAGVKLEHELNLKLKTGHATRVHVAFVPTSRDELYQALVEGRGDIVAATVTVTPERAHLVDFTVPTMSGVSDVLVTGPGAAVVHSLGDLIGKTVYVRDRSIQFDGLTALNASLRQQGKPGVDVRVVPTSLEDEDILEMVNAGLIKATVVSSPLAAFWAQVLPNIRVHPNIAVREHSDVAWAVRKGSTGLLQVLNPYIAKSGRGTVFGNVLFQKYLKDTRMVRAATSESEMAKFSRLVDIFRRYGDKYSLDYLLMMAQGYQESRLDQHVKSRVGAVGVMQVMPATGKELGVGDISEVEANIHAGVKYVRFMIDKYFAGEPIDPLNKGLFAFAAYNCGPGRLRQLRREAERQGMNPNVWFNNVERVAAERIGRETVQYVSNIYKYYVAYTLAAREQEERDAVRGKIGG
jgi:membrane-bound lytic murein transglycosylase MltF